MAARGSPATKKPKCDPSDLTRLPDAELAAQIEALDTEQRAADAAFKTQIQAIDATRRRSSTPNRLSWSRLRVAIQRSFIPRGPFPRQFAAYFTV